VHLTIRPPESDSQSESYRVPSCETEKRQKSPDSNSYGSGIRSKNWSSLVKMMLAASRVQPIEQEVLLGLAAAS